MIFYYSRNLRKLPDKIPFTLIGSFHIKISEPNPYISDQKLHCMLLSIFLSFFFVDRKIIMNVKRFIKLIMKTHHWYHCKIEEWLRLEETSGDHLLQALLKERHLQQVTQGCVQLGLEYLQGWKLLSFDEESGLVFDHPNCKKSLPYIHQNFLNFSLCSCPRTPLRKAWLHCLYSPIRYLYTCIRSFQAFPSPGWIVPSLSGRDSSVI